MPLRELLRVAGRRWSIEEAFQAAGKDLAGLDEHQIRRWTCWRRWTLLTMIAHAPLTVITVREHDQSRLELTRMVGVRSHPAPGRGGAGTR